MSEDEDLDAAWERWCEDFDQVGTEVHALFFTRWMWRTLTGLMNNGNPDRQWTTVQDYFIRTYVTTACTAIRREADADVRTTSMVRCLKALLALPAMATRDRYRVGLVAAADREAEEARAAGFDHFAGGSGR